MDEDYYLGFLKEVELMQYLDMISNETDRGLALITASYLDNIIEKAFRENLIIPNKTFSDKLFNHNGAALGSLSIKCDIALAFGWIDEFTFKDIATIRAIRNKFAHYLDVSSFADDKIKSLVSQIYNRKPDESLLKGMEFIFESPEKLNSDYRLSYEIRTVRVINELIFYLTFSIKHFKDKMHPEREIKLDEDFTRINSSIMAICSKSNIDMAVKRGLTLTEEGKKVYTNLVSSTEKILE